MASQTSRRAKGRSGRHRNEAEDSDNEREADCDVAERRLLQSGHSSRGHQGYRPSIVYDLRDATIKGNINFPSERDDQIIRSSRSSPVSSRPKTQLRKRRDQFALVGGNADVSDTSTNISRDPSPAPSHIRKTKQAISQVESWRERDEGYGTAASSSLQRDKRYSESGGAESEYTNARSHMSSSVLSGKKNGSCKKAERFTQSPESLRRVTSYSSTNTDRPSRKPPRAIPKAAVPHDDGRPSSNDSELSSAEDEGDEEEEEEQEEQTEEEEEDNDDGDEDDEDGDSDDVRKRSFLIFH